MVSLLEQAQEYLTLSSKGKLTASEQLKIAICRQFMESNDIRSSADIDSLHERAENLGKKISALKGKLEGCRQRYDVNSDISKTYAEISKGDYIGRLVEEERQIRENERNKRKNKL